MRMPVIGVTVNNTILPSKDMYEQILGFTAQEWHLVAHDYIRELEEAGALPILLPIYRKNLDPKRIIELCDGILVTGGRNTDPQRFGEKISPSISSINPWRDEWEIELIQELLKNGKIPVLGTCRGIQIINVACGGTLYQNLMEGGKDYHLMPPVIPAYHKTHNVTLTEGSRIREIMGESVIGTNSFHTMGVKALGKGLVATGTTPDGLVEVLEHEDRSRFFLATQFHPELMAPVHTEFRKIYNAFIQAATAYAESK